MKTEKCNVNELKTNLNEVISIRDELQSIDKPPFPNMVCTLKVYGVRLLNKIREVNPDEPYNKIRLRAIHRLENQMDVPNHLLNSAFKTNRNKLVGVLNSYANGLQKEFSKTE